MNLTVEQLAQGEMDEELKALGLAYLYVEYDLQSDAIATLETFVERNNQSIAVRHTLAELYWRVGLARKTEKAFTDAVELAKATGDKAQQQLIEARLAALWQNLNPSEEESQ